MKNIGWFLAGSAVIALVSVGLGYRVGIDAEPPEPELTQEQLVHKTFLECLGQHNKKTCWIDERYSSPECEEYARTLYGLEYKDRDTDRSITAVNKAKAEWEKSTERLVNEKRALCAFIKGKCLLAQADGRELDWDCDDSCKFNYDEEEE